MKNSADLGECYLPRPSAATAVKRVAQKQRKGRLWFSLILISSFDTEAYSYIYIF